MKILNQIGDFSNRFKKASAIERTVFVADRIVKIMLVLLAFVAFTNDAWAEKDHHNNNGDTTNNLGDTVVDATSNIVVETPDVNVDVAGDTNTLTGGTQTVSNTTSLATGSTTQALNLDIEGDNYYNFTMGENHYEQLGGYKRSLTTVNVHAMGNDDDYMVGAGVSFSFGGSDTGDMADLYRQEVKNKKDIAIMQQCSAMAVSGLEYRDSNAQYADTYQTVGDLSQYCKQQFKFTDTETAKRLAELNLLNQRIAVARAQQYQLMGTGYSERENANSTHVTRHIAMQDILAGCKATPRTVDASLCHKITAPHYGQ